MKSIEYRFYHDGVAMSFWKGTNGTTIVFASGLPQYITSYHPFVNTLINMGYSLLVPKYHGTWESDGDFTLANSLQSLNSALDLVSIGGAVELFASVFIEIPNRNVFLMGFSYGGLNTLLVDKSVNKKILLMPFVNLELHGKENLEKDLLFVKRAYPNVYKYDVGKMLDDLDNIVYPEKSDNLIVVVGEKDKSITKLEIDWLTKRYQSDIISIENLSHTANLSKEQFDLIFNKS